MIEVSAGIVYDRAGRVLICRRGEGRSNAHLWEFPGGKREAGESAADCLMRELMEELSLPVTEVTRFAAYPHGNIRFTFLTARTEKLPVLTEHEDARFVPPRELPGYDFCPADVQAARWIALRGVRHVFWDFDGTLLDSYPAMVRAFIAGAAEFGVAVTAERTLSLMKNCLTHCCEVIGAENDIPPRALGEAFRRHEQAELQRGLPRMPGVPETLAALRRAGVRHYVITHRDLQCRALLERAGLLEYFSGFVTREDGLPRKPAPDMVLHLMAGHGLDPARCMMVGDRPLDARSGMAAGALGVLIDPEGRFSDADCDLRIPEARGLISPACMDEMPFV